MTFASWNAEVNEPRYPGGGRSRASRAPRSAPCSRTRPPKAERAVTEPVTIKGSSRQADGPVLRSTWLAELAQNWRVAEFLIERACFVVEFVDAQFKPTGALTSNPALRLADQRGTDSLPTIRPGNCDVVQHSPGLSDEYREISGLFAAARWLSRPGASRLLPPTTPSVRPRSAVRRSLRNAVPQPALGTSKANASDEAGPLPRAERASARSHSAWRVGRRRCQPMSRPRSKFDWLAMREPILRDCLAARLTACNESNTRCANQFARKRSMSATVSGGSSCIG